MVRRPEDHDLIILGVLYGGLVTTLWWLLAFYLRGKLSW